VISVFLNIVFGVTFKNVGVHGHDRDFKGSFFGGAG
jgi:hypothetical protein